MDPRHKADLDRIHGELDRIMGELGPDDRTWYQQAGDWLATSPVAWMLPGLVLVVALPTYAVRGWAALYLGVVITWRQAALIAIVIGICVVWGELAMVLGYRLGQHFRREEDANGSKATGDDPVGHDRPEGEADPASDR
jgi:hypothetical protein